MNRTVYLDDGGVYCAAGSHIDMVWQHLAAGKRNLSILPCPPIEGWPWPSVFTVDEPSSSMLDVDRKLLRTMEKQAKLALYGALLTLRGSSLLRDVSKDRIGLYLGLPTVEDSVLPWPLLETLYESGDQRLSTDVLMREMPSFIGLSQLNSSACAHIAGTFGITGAMGIYSTFADAGLQAVIEAALSIGECESDAALVGGVSQKINPLLLLQYAHWGWLHEPGNIPGEGAAFAVLNADSKASRRIRVSGHARGFVGGAAQAMHADVLQRALHVAGIAAADLDWILPGKHAAAEHAALQTICGHAALPLGGCEAACGELGPAGPILNLLLAGHGMRVGKRLLCASSDAAHLEEQMPLQHALVTAMGPEGQYVAVILSLELA